eukprot:8116645-Ditylum_brightwellii.AAC.1
MNKLIYKIYSDVKQLPMESESRLKPEIEPRLYCLKFCFLQKSNSCTVLTWPVLFAHCRQRHTGNSEATVSGLH